MRSFTSVPQNTFDIVADGYGDALKNACFQSPPYSQVGSRFSELADRGATFPIEARYKAFQEIKCEDLAGLPSKLFDACHVEVFAIGNTTPTDASKLGETLSKALQISKVLDVLPERKEATLMP